MKSKQLKVINPVPDITLFAVNMITRGFQQPKWHKYIGFNFDETVSAYKDNFVEWCVPLPLWRKLGNAFFKKISTSKSFARQVYQKHHFYGQKLYADCDKIRRKDIKSLTNKQIEQDFKKIQESFYELCFWGVVPPVIDFENNLLTGWLEKKLEAAVKKYPISETFQEVFSILTTPRELTYLQKESDDLLRLAMKKKVTEKDITKHQYKYSWTDYGYMGPIHTLSYYARRLKQIKKGSNSPIKKIKEIASDRLKIKKRQAAFTRKLHFNAKTKYLFKIAREFMALKLYRKEVMFKGYYVIDLLFKEIGRRRGYTIQQLRYCLPDEIVQMLQGKNIDKNELNKRAQTYFVHAFIRGRDYFYYGEKARKYMVNNLYEEKIDTSVKQIKGMSAYIGKATGVVKIINKAAEIKKVEKGDVLISIATSPAILPAMKVASAFVTDTGGITCHAAIVSRELGIPCVIGTKIATKVFKDGDRVEVDATKGIVRKL